MPHFSSELQTSFQPHLTLATYTHWLCGWLSSHNITHTSLFCSITTMRWFSTALVILTTSLVTVSAASGPTQCLAFDVNWNLLAFEYGGKDYTAGTQDLWGTSGSATDITTSGRPWVCVLVIFVPQLITIAVAAHLINQTCSVSSHRWDSLAIFGRWWRLWCSLCNVHWRCSRLSILPAFLSTFLLSFLPALLRSASRGNVIILSIWGCYPPY